jgi:hypothetical protein
MQLQTKKARNAKNIASKVKVVVKDKMMQTGIIIIIIK